MRPSLIYCIHTIKEDILARDNYSYQKFRREQAKKKKKEEKMQRKLDKKNKQSEGVPGTVSDGDAAVNPVNEAGNKEA
jgi:hypothetical protein